MASAPRKVLMLHGKVPTRVHQRYAQNATIFSKRLGALRKSVGEDIEMVFVNGPIVLHPVDIDGTSSTASLAALGASDTTSSDLSTAPRGWCKLNPERTVTYRMEESLLLFRDILQRDRYDGVFGFSQGAAMAALLAALLERPHLYPPFLVDGEAPHPPFKFCVAVSGFKAPGSLSAEIFGTSYSTPTLHVLGRTDVVVIEERTKDLIDLSHNKRVEEHQGGHFVPSGANWKEFFRNYLVDPLGVITSTELISASQEASGDLLLRRLKPIPRLVIELCVIPPTGPKHRLPRLGMRTPPIMTRLSSSSSGKQVKFA
ncbi:serine hydrolase-domain-containing protein [Suillus paluster]|uniref:serine hydrolase-domain-containing protein n=1 Tax=Suillus paluster TaxID=48578 RepID=UPI001B872B4C|nr:serine hydrolase-domain-containing protein [Suillus paluster]KAG1739100.1 serine hydrolase-domain-containing protein [Suillus paluster]